MGRGVRGPQGRAATSFFSSSALHRQRRRSPVRDPVRLLERQPQGSQAAPRRAHLVRVRQEEPL